MCFDWKTSLATFIVGTAINLWNVIRYKFEATIVAVSVIWEFVILMQLWEAIAWLNQPDTSGDSKRCNLNNTIAAKGAFITNVMQPVVLALVMFALAGSEVTTEEKIAAGTVIGAYLIWLLHSVNKAPEVKCLTRSATCKNLIYDWWNDYPGNATAYLLTLGAVILLLIKPLNFAIGQFAFIFGTLLVSTVFYSCGGAGSVWCWMAAFAPLLTGSLYEMTKI